MSGRNNDIDFSRGRYKEMLVWQRKRMWTDEEMERYSKWMGIFQGMTAVDVGCGLGYLGYTFWKYFGTGGHYTGIDIKLDLLKEASKAAESWEDTGIISFITGDVYNLPFPESFADWVMCQTLFIHLENPNNALLEMVRILKPGGLILCIEPDNLRPALVRSFSSLPELDIETQLLVHKVNTIANRGRVKMGRGDNGIAPQLPHMLHDLGVGDIDVKVRESVPFLEPPYETELQQEKVKNMEKYHLSQEAFNARVKEQRKEFLAGGGDPADYDRLLEVGEKLRKIQIKQMENREFYICGAYPIYLIKGKKPV